MLLCMTHFIAWKAPAQNGSTLAYDDKAAQTVCIDFSGDSLVVRCSSCRRAVAHIVSSSSSRRMNHDAIFPAHVLVV